MSNAKLSSVTCTIVNVFTTDILTQVFCRTSLKPGVQNSLWDRWAVQTCQHYSRGAWRQGGGTLLYWWEGRNVRIHFCGNICYCYFPFYPVSNILTIIISWTIHYSTTTTIHGIIYHSAVKSVPSDPQHNGNPAELWASDWRHTHHSNWTSLECWEDPESHSKWHPLPY